MNRLLLCPPDFYEVRYEINPWMNRLTAVDAGEARVQWRRLVEVLESLEVRVELLKPSPGLPDMVFTANAGLLHGRRFFSSRFRHPERQGETPFYEDWFARQGCEVLHPPEGIDFEGEGDALWLGDTLVCGHGFRTDPRAHEWLGQTLGCDTLNLELVNPHFYHLDTCFCPLDAHSVLWHPPAFSASSRLLLESHDCRLIAVPEAEARRFACNAVVLGSHVLLPAGCPQVCRLLRDTGFTCHSLAMSEFIKAGGACKCLVLRIGGGQ